MPTRETVMFSHTRHALLIRTVLLLQTRFPPLPSPRRAYPPSSAQHSRGTYAGGFQSNTEMESKGKKGEMRNTDKNKIAKTTNAREVAASAGNALLI